MILGFAIPLLILLGIIALIVVVIQRAGKKVGNQGAGADIVPYLVLALAMGVSGFALAELASTAFPGQTFVFDPASEIATSLAALVVATPFVVYFWRRQARRRAEYPAAPGWTLYVSLVELVFMTAFVVTAVMFLNGLFSDEPTSSWARPLVFGAIVVFHEFAARANPPLSEARELPRVIGSAIGLVTTTAGLIGVIGGLIGTLFESGDAFGVTDPGFHPWVALVIVGAPIWWYRWLRRWEEQPTTPRMVWTVIASVGSLATAIGAATQILASVLSFVLTDTPPAGQHFDLLPITGALVVVGIPVWLVHRRSLGAENDAAFLAYRYAMAALGLAATVSMGVALSVAAFDRSLIVGGEGSRVVTYAVTFLVGLGVWLLFERRADRTDTTVTWPGRVYRLGLGIVMGLVAAGALIAFLFVLLQRVLGADADGSLLEPGAILVFAGLATWYLLHVYLRDRDQATGEVDIAPFEVTIICSEPGPIARLLPEQARLDVFYRDDSQGVIGEEMADEIVAAIDGHPSLVWVDGDGFRVASRRTPT